MAITSSIGYGGPVFDTEVPTWARSLGGVDYAVMTASAWKVTAVGAAARTVSVAPGAGYGRGIYDTSTTTNVVIPNPASGSLWHVVVARRNMSSGTTTFTYCPGTEAGGSVAIGQRSTFETTNGEIDDQPLALVRVTSGQSAIQQVIDIRCWQANGGLVAADPQVRNYLSRVGTHMTLPDGLTYTRVAKPDGSVPWIATPAIPTVRRWSGTEGAPTRLWGPTSAGTMVGATITAGPPGEYLVTAEATVKRNNGTGAIQLFKSLQITEGTTTTSTTEYEDDAYETAWRGKTLILPITRTTTGTFQVAYRIRPGGAQLAVKAARIDVMYLGPVAAS